ncbi:NTP/NDP exchange transporter [Sedimenticola selenatireducens]|uniref:MFS transporter n=1 Tax=Sedimenticola selenatireducens TaxID=191960 RepID=A0A557SK57_9GAMM|nr:MFS transporter [Sedimenticola selenatireducens]TVO77817.1 MFS transporter [Sedimenticola selenatireducens]TVT65122.1 MAG: MFS transporter [Sedimenticola selenatireducens]
MKHIWPRLYQRIRNSIQVESDEVQALLWSFSYFFALLCSYYIIRPMRDEMGILGGVENLQWLFTGTLLAMTAAIPLFGWVSSRFPRRQFLPYVYLFFIGSLLLFYALMNEQNISIYMARTFFIWASVFNLFVVSVFWSFMADIYSNAQARRLFGFIAAGGTVGALAGPAITTLLVEPIGPRNLLLISALFLSWAILCIIRLSRWSKTQSPEPTDATKNVEEEAIGGSIWDGIRLVIRSPYLLGICLLMLLFTTLATFLYLMQAQIIRDALVDSAQRTALFAQIDLAVNALTLILQLFLTSRLIKWLNLPVVLALIPLLLAIGFILLGFAPILSLLIIVQVIRRAGNYAIMRPAREMLYVVLSKEEKYKAKNVIDTVVYRTGDAVSAWIYSGMRTLGISLSGIAFIAVPLALVWAWVAYKLGREQQIKAEVAHVK